jgi:hypothetical protein
MPRVQRFKTLEGWLQLHVDYDDDYEELEEEPRQ